MHKLASLVALISLMPVVVWAESLPQWEVGFGMAGLSMPDYRGSDEQRAYLLPVPYIIYRGDVVTVDRRGLLSKLFETQRLRLDVSMNAGVPVKSHKNAARAGMPDLDPTFEIGPLLEVCLDRLCNGKPTWTFRLPARAVIATDLSHTHDAGWVFNPHINYDDHIRLFDASWDLGVAVGPVYATRRHHDYYYQVEPGFATPTRPVYAARGGYAGSRITLALSRHYDSLWIGSFLRYESLSGAVFDDSPLLRSQRVVMAGVGLSWVFVRSQTRVEADS